MNTTTLSPSLPDRPEVATFVARVRDHLADLTPDEQEELVGGLEADLAEQAAEQGTGQATGQPMLVLPDPATYAAELRVAAGLPPRRRAARLRRGPITWTRVGIAVTTGLDRLRDRTLALANRTRATRWTWQLLEALRPAWWVLRAWIAVQWLDLVLGPWEYLTIIPTLGSRLAGAAALVVAIVLSVLIGQGRLWPGSGPDRSPLARLVLLGLTVFAICVPVVFVWPPTGGGGPYAGYQLGYRDGTHRSGLYVGPRVVHNIYAYDAAGQPLIGVQLFDGQGRPITVTPSSTGSGAARRVTCPWFNGSTPLFNVFPLPEQARPRHRCESTTVDGVGPAASQPAAPLAAVPPVTPTP